MIRVCKTGKHISDTFLMTLKVIAAKYYISSQIAMIHTLYAHTVEFTVGSDNHLKVSTSEQCHTALVFKL